MCSNQLSYVANDVTYCGRCRATTGADYTCELAEGQARSENRGEFLLHLILSRRPRRRQISSACLTAGKPGSPSAVFTCCWPTGFMYATDSRGTRRSSAPSGPFLAGAPFLLRFVYVEIFL